jgi:hypothetical protein
MILQNRNKLFNVALFWAVLHVRYCSCSGMSKKTPGEPGELIHVSTQLVGGGSLFLWCYSTCTMVWDVIIPVGYPTCRIWDEISAKMT